MGRKAKFSFEAKMDIIQRCLKGKSSINQEAKCLGINKNRIYECILLYQSLGNAGFITTSKNTVYSSYLKQNAVLDYLEGNGSYLDTCKKYGIRSSTQLRNWIMKYNGHEKLKASGTGGSIMIKGRTTTFDERIEIVQYCIAHNYNYAETSEKYQVSYQQARNYTVKYETGGIDALKDNRGKRKSENEMNELDRLQAENRILRAEKENNRIAEIMETIHKESPDKGYRRISAELERYLDTPVNDKRVLRICRKRNIKSTIKYSNNGCTRQAVNPQYIAKNILNREFAATAPNEK
jgi:transposase-like protein